jgi:hypothetical protein
MPEQFTPVAMSNGSGVPLDAAYFNRLETAMENMDDRGAALERGVITPVTINYAATITPDAGAGALFRCSATGDVTLNDPINGDDGQTITVEILASGGASRNLSFAGSTASGVTIAAGTWWKGELTFHAPSTWVLDD